VAKEEKPVLRKKKADVPPPGAPLWMTTYGDMITLVLTFFILLFAFSSIDAQKYIQIANSLKGALGGNLGVLNTGSSVTPEGAMTSIAPTSYNQIMKQLKSILDKTQTKENVEVRGDGKEIIVSFKEKLFFRIGSADILKEALPVLSDVGAVIRDQKLIIRVEGHTCNIPIRTVRFPSNWELSAIRAVNVARYLIESIGIVPERLSVAAYGQYRPMVPNTSAENRARNRRVDIVITNINKNPNFNNKEDDNGGRR
jgi:chemotaxis protein MotB